MLVVKNNCELSKSFSWVKVILYLESLPPSAKKTHGRQTEGFAKDIAGYFGVGKNTRR